jgi:capsid protein
MTVTGYITNVARALTGRHGRRLARGAYDAVEDRGRRRPARNDTRSEDAILTSAKRKKLVGTARDVIRNYCTAAWMVRAHLDYVSSFAFQARTGADDLDAALEDLIWSAGLRKNFDVGGRFSLAKSLRISEARRVLDGDVFWAKLASGRVQIIEGDRVRLPSGGIPPDSGWAKEDFPELYQGVSVSPGGRMQAVCICKRTADGSGYEFERVIPARNVWQHAFWDTTYRVDQVRGITPLAPALNSLQDIYEGCDLAMAKAKVAQMFGLVFFRKAMEEQEGWAASRAAGGDDDGETAGEGGADATPAAQDSDLYDVDPGSGPFKLELQDGDDAKFLSTNTPETELLNWMQFSTDLAIKCLDIPYSFYDTSKANYYGRKADIQQYEASARSKREDNSQLLDEWTAWRLRLAILDGSLALPGAMTLDQVEWEWVPAGMPWVDKLRDMKADQLAIESHLDNVPRVARRAGQDAYEIAREQLDYEKWLIAERAKRGLPPLAGGPGQGGDAGNGSGGEKPAGTTDSEGKVDDNA